MITKADIKRESPGSKTWVVVVWHHRADHVVTPSKCRCRHSHNEHRFDEFRDAVTFVASIAHRIGNPDDDGAAT